MKKVLLPEKIVPEAMILLGEKANVVVAEDSSEESILAEIDDTFGIVLRSKAKITRGIMDAAPELRVISRTGVGYDNIDVQAATDHKILVCNLPGINAVSVAEHAMTFILSLAKQISTMDAFVRSDQWEKRSSTEAIDVKGKTLGIIGLGRIGREVMKLAYAFGMSVLVFDPYLSSMKSEVTFSKTVEEIFIQSDFVSIHVPNLPETSRMVGWDLLRLMKPSSFFINTSRGGVVDEKALVRVLSEKRIAGAALDVFENEPITPDHPLTAMKNVVLTPHSAALTRECKVKMAVEAVRQVIDCIEGRIPPHIVNSEQLIV
ncbi:D-3-phosphoglycerate dehydrogenase [Peptococcaceae bacterium CEB3]|nr:D-3-phosphoglycerate dehydrogenase [Peptococcaceae bacterium CEB3]